MQYSVSIETSSKVKLKTPVSTNLYNKIGSEGDEQSDYIQQTKDSGYIIIGDLSVKGESFNIFLIKTDSRGWVMKREEKKETEEKNPRKEGR